MSIWLFYSKKCQHCNEFINLAMKNKVIAKKINQVDIEENADRLPSFLTSIPTLQLEDNNVLVGTQCFKWLEKVASESLEPGPLANSRGGFETIPYTTISNTDDSGVFKSYTNIEGVSNGSEGMESLATTIGSEVESKPGSLEDLQYERSMS